MLDESPKDLKKWLEIKERRCFPGLDSNLPNIYEVGVSKSPNINIPEEYLCD